MLYLTLSYALMVQSDLSVGLTKLQHDSSMLFHGTFLQKKAAETISLIYDYSELSMNPQDIKNRMIAENHDRLATIKRIVDSEAAKQIKKAAELQESELLKYNQQLIEQLRQVTAHGIENYKHFEPILRQQRNEASAKSGVKSTEFYWANQVYKYYKKTYEFTRRNTFVFQYRILHNRLNGINNLAKQLKISLETSDTALKNGILQQ